MSGKIENFGAFDKNTEIVMCEHFMNSEAVIVPREKGDKNE